MKPLVILVLASFAVGPNSVAAQTKLGPAPGAREHSESVEDLLNKAEHLLNTAEHLLNTAEQGDAQSQYELAVHYASRGPGQLSSSEAVHWLRRAAEQGYAEAQSDLGLLYHRGIGVERNPVEAAQWLRRAAEQGHAVSQADFGQLYYLGAGVPKDFAKAAEWYRRAAEQGLAAAQYNLAGLYMAGEGVGKNLPEAVRWARDAAIQGHPQAQLLLARQHEKGLGVKRDAGRALQWYRFAAEQGQVEAQRSLGVFYAEGRGGAVDLVQGRMWLVIASLKAPEGRREVIARQRDEVGRGMSAEQIDETEGLAKQWKRKTWAELKAGTPGELIPGRRFTNLSGFFGRAGRNISAAESEYDRYWRPHIEKSRHRILEAAELVEEARTALVLGAGKCREIPLERLARKFDRVVLVDLDGPSMREAVARLPEELRAKIEVRVSDVTSFAQPLMEATSRIVEGAQSADEAFTELGALYREMDALRRYPELPRADLVISSLVLSELARYPRTYTAQLVKEKFDADLSEWSGYRDLWRNLRTFASMDHAELLGRFIRPGGAVYFADTVARGPDLSKVDREERRSALNAVAGRFARIHLFKELRARSETWSLFGDVFRKLEFGKRDAGTPLRGIKPGNFEKLVSDIETSPDAVPDRSDLVAEAAGRLLCRDHLPAALEVVAYEAMIESYREVDPGTLEQFLDWNPFFAALEGSELEPVGDTQSWWWLEYACSIPRKAGGFLVRSRVLRERGERRD